LGWGDREFEARPGPCYLECMPDRRTVVQTGIVTSNVPDRSTCRSWSCQVKHQGSTRTISIGSQAVTFGAGRDCDVVLEDPAVSREHTELQATPEGLRVRDLDSTNGTFFQSSRISEIMISSDAVVRLGDTNLHLSGQPAPSIPPSRRRQFGSLVGQSQMMREVFAVLELVSPTETTTLIEGETGTGKELAARAIHDHSDRATGPFGVVDCGSTNEQLIESQLFGHVRGAFTDAVADRKGAFTEAHGGTIFLDEIGELPLGSQTKLLRALEARTVTPLGTDKSQPVDVRVVAATNRSLYDMVTEKTFRADLFYRLSVVHVRIPALRERPEDLPELIRHFYKDRGLACDEIAGPNLERLQRHQFAGNVRELRNVLERAWVLSGPTGAGFADLRLDLNTPARQEMLGLSVDTSLPFKEAKERWTEVFERRYLGAVFADHDHNITRAAEKAGINRNHFRKLLEKYGLIKP